MKKGDGFRVYEFMVRDLGLTKNCLLIYAYIYNATVTKGAYYGTHEEIANAVGAPEKAVQQITKELVNAKYIERVTIDGRMRAYKALLPEYTQIN